jgi:hypothetical protein
MEGASAHGRPTVADRTIGIVAIRSTTRSRLKPIAIDITDVWSFDARDALNTI